MSAIDDRIILQFICPKCRNKFGKLPSWLKPGGKVTCPKCGDTFVDEEILKAAEALSKHRKAK
jgi:predicted nucleic-acid-binding Zn-ribbon protein